MQLHNNKYSQLLLATLSIFTTQIYSQETIVNNEVIQQDIVESVDGNEMIEYLKDVSSEQVSVQCMQNKMCIKIEKQFLVDKEITTHFDKLELRNITDKCNPTYINSNTEDDWEDNTHVELCTTDGFLSCGTRMEMNDTHVSYINQIMTKNEDNQDPGMLMSPIIKEYVIPWHCIYPLEYVVGLETKGSDGDGYYIPDISPIEYITIQSPLLQKENTYPVFMQLFETNQYRTPYTEAPTLTNTEKLFVEVKMVGPDDAKIQLVNCWATPFGGQTQQELDEYKFDLIEDYCVTEEASDTVAASINKNGRSHSSQYEANVFKYNREVGTDKVYLHCNVRVCFDDNGQCDLTRGFCDNNRRRKRRALSDDVEIALDPSITTVHAGPFRLLNDEAYLIEAQNSLEKLEFNLQQFELIEREESKKRLENQLFGLPLMFVYSFIAILIIIVVLSCGIVFLVVKRKRETQKYNENAHNTLDNSKIKVIEQMNQQIQQKTTADAVNAVLEAQNKAQKQLELLQSSIKSNNHTTISDLSRSDRSSESNHSVITQQTHISNSKHLKSQNHHNSHHHHHSRLHLNSSQSSLSRSDHSDSVPVNHSSTHHHHHQHHQSHHTLPHETLSRNASNSEKSNGMVALVKQNSRLAQSKNNLIDAYSSIRNHQK